MMARDSEEKKHFSEQSGHICFYMEKKIFELIYRWRREWQAYNSVCFACDMSIFFSLGKTLSEQSWSAIFQLCCLAIVHRASQTYRQMAASICDMADYKEA